MVADRVLDVCRKPGVLHGLDALLALPAQQDGLAQGIGLPQLVPLNPGGRVVTNRDVAGRERRVLV